MDDLLKNVKQNLRAVTQSCKEGVLIHRISSDYQNLVGEPIQFRRLGFNSLEDMLTSMHDVVHLKREKGQIFVKAVPTASTQHITDLVANQRSSKSKTVPKNRPLKNSNQGPAYIPHYPQHYFPRYPSKQGGNKRNSSEIPPRFQQHHHQQQFNQRRRPQTDNWLPAAVPLPAIGPMGDGDGWGHPLPYSGPPATARAPQRPGSRKKPLLPPPPPQTFPKTQPPKQPNNRKKTNKEILAEWAEKRQVKVGYTSQMIGIMKDVRSETAVVTVADKKYSSFPHSASTVHEAEEEAARKAVEALNILQDTQPPLPVASMSTQEDILNLGSRISELLSQDNTSCGVWNSLVEELYKKNYQEQLPEGWLSHLGECPSIAVDRIDDHRSILKYISPMKRKQVQEEVPQKEVPPIELPQSNNWDVQLVYVPQGGYVAVHLVDYLERFEQLCHKMDTFYSDKGELVGDKLEVDQLCALSVEGNWHRMLCTDVLDNNKVELYFVDYGDSNVVDVSKCYVLEPEFYELPYQAIWCCLLDLEDYADDKDCQGILSNYVSSVLIATVSNLSTFDSSLPDFLPSKYGPSNDNFMVEVVLYDTSTEDDININELIKTKVTQSRLTPKMPEVGQFQEVIPRFLTPSGDLFFSHPGLGVQELEKLMEEVNQKALNLVGHVDKIDERDIYCAMFPDDGLFYRAIVSDYDASTSMAEVFYIDFGNTAKVAVKDLIEASHFSRQFVELPVQALRAKLHGLPPQGCLWTEDARNKFSNYMPSDSVTVKMKVVTAPKETELAEIELFIKRPDPSNPEVDILASINQNLAIDTSIFEKIDGDAKEEIQVKSRIPAAKVLRTVNPHPKSQLQQTATENGIPPPPIAASSPQKTCPAPAPVTNCVVAPPKPAAAPENGIEEHSLVPPSVPKEGEYFNIRITLAANPNKFVCQPYNEEHKLASLMKEMQSFYNSEENLIEMADCLIKVHGFYAGKNHETGMWCRVCVKHIIKQQAQSPIKSSNQVSAYFVDFGDYRALFLEDLQPLYNSFRRLPFQALHASLCGETRLKRDWTPTECVAFKKLVVDKPLVSIVRGKLKDTNFPFLNAEELLLTLVDTTVEGTPFNFPFWLEPYVDRKHHQGKKHHGLY